MERIPPHNDEAERSVLGSALLSKDALFDVVELLTEDDFYSEIHKEIFRSIKELYRKVLRWIPLLFLRRLKEGTLWKW